VCPSYLDGDRRIHLLALPDAVGFVRERSRTQMQPVAPLTGAAVIPVCWHGCAVFKVRARRAPRTGALGLSKLNSMGRASELGAPRSGRHFGSRSGDRLEAAGPATKAWSAGGGCRWLRRHGMRRPPERPLQSWSFPRKEVIQPHLPVRLPCYDFTPVTSPTFDGSLPEG
jgi:hypothetical protein